jgi:hypothetical protein
MRHPTYLHCSCHGVYYFRARTPAGLRRLHPELPIEVKTSFGTKNLRSARTTGILSFDNR